MEITAATAGAARAIRSMPILPSSALHQAPSPEAEVWPITWSRGFHVVTSANAPRPIEQRPTGADLIEFYFQIDGTAHFRRDNGWSLICRPGSSAVVFHTANSTTEWSTAATSDRYVSLLCTGAFLEQLLMNGIGDTAELVRELRASGGRTLDYSPAAAAAAQDLLGCEACNGLNRLRAEAKSIEFLCALLDALFEPCAKDLPVVLSERDVSRLHQARQVIMDRLNEALTIPQLARAVGVNQQKLKVGFKHLFGQTIFDYATQVRMSEAMRLVTSEVMPISVIASRVGYRCAASFSRAFERFHGCAPRSARKRASGRRRS